MAENGLPFVTPEPEALLPSPMLSTLNALKLLQGKGFDRWDAKARCEAEMLYSNGIQVEWVPFPSYTAWQQYMEGSAATWRRTFHVQQQSALQPHIVDTALMFLQWLEGPQILREISAVLGTSDTAEGKLTGPVLHAILSEGGKALDAKFLELNRGQASHRLKDAKTLLRCSSTESLKALLNFRKKALPIVANLFAQSWLLQPEWAALAGRSLTLDGQSFDVQTLVMSQAARALSSAEILTNTEIPRVRRSPLSLALFRELCNVQIPAAEYVGRLLAKYGGVSTRTLCGLMRRLLVDGEPRLRESFLQGYTVAVRSGGKDAFLFADCCPESEYALVEEKLQAQLDARTRESAAAAGEGSAAVQKSSDDAPAGDKEAMPAPASSGGEGGEEQATRAAIQADVEVQMADVFLLYNGVPASPDQVPDLPQQQGRLWVVPPPNNSRGRPDRSVSVKLGHLPWLVAVGEGDAVLIGLGHNPGIADAVRTSLKESWSKRLFRRAQRSIAFALGLAEGGLSPSKKGFRWPEQRFFCPGEAQDVRAV
ncbi:unnamed protein product [Effrenium voratum]|nr:unnamed protein product [Effrenium voratum]